MANIETLVKRMLIEDPFYGFMLTSLDRRYSNRLERIGVYFNENMNAELLINEEWFNQWPEEIQMGLLKHELLHIAFKHIVMGKDFANKRLFNIAADLEINCYIPNLPRGKEGCFVEDLGLPERQGTLWYYRELLKQPQKPQKKSSQKMNGTGMSITACPSDDTDDEPTEDNEGINEERQEEQDSQEQNQQEQPDDSEKSEEQKQYEWRQQQLNEKNIIDDHSMWEDEENVQAQEVVASVINDMLLKTAEGVKSQGYIPGELASIISELQKPLEPVFDWKKAFRRFLGNAYTEHKKRSRRKESRRFEGSAGSQHKKRANVLVAIDTSGSVSDYELREFVSELTYMHKTGTRIHVLECDASIQREYDFKPGCITGVAGRGGTLFEPVIDYYREYYREYETLIYLTDGGASIDFTVPQNNMLWVISSAGLHQDYPGKALYIPKSNN